MAKLGITSSQKIPGLMSYAKNFGKSSHHNYDFDQNCDFLSKFQFLRKKMGTFSKIFRKTHQARNFLAC